MRASEIHEEELPGLTETLMAVPNDVEEKIRARAYELYVTRGMADGREIDDWLQAEQEISGLLSGLTTKAA